MTEEVNQEPLAEDEIDVEENQSMCPLCECRKILVISVSRKGRMRFTCDSCGCLFFTEIKGHFDMQQEAAKASGRFLGYLG